MGGRDLALGVGALRALRISDDEARPWVALGGMADAVDALATVLAFRPCPAAAGGASWPSPSGPPWCPPGWPMTLDSTDARLRPRAGPDAVAV